MTESVEGIRAVEYIETYTDVKSYVYERLRHEGIEILEHSIHGCTSEVKIQKNQSA